MARNSELGAGEGGCGNLERVEHDVGRWREEWTAVQCSNPCRGGSIGCVVREGHNKLSLPYIEHVKASEGERVEEPSVDGRRCLFHSYKAGNNA